MKKKVLFVVVALLASITNVVAYDFKVDGIYYTKVGDGNVSVVQDLRGSSCYWGEIVIPAVVEYEGVMYNVNSIGKEAFFLCDNITAITLPNSINSIGDYAFKYCMRLSSIVIPDNVTTIGENAFGDCYELTTIILPKRMEHLGGGAFGSCTNLTTITLPEGITRIESGLFGLCSNLSSVIIPDGITSIGVGAFNHCYNLSSILIPESVTSIEEGAFYECGSLTSIVIPNGVTQIEEKTFYSCWGLTSIVLPESLTSIGEEAFADCWGLTSLHIPNEVTTIGDHAFEGCAGLDTVFIPKNVSKIGNYPFPTTFLSSLKVDDDNPFYDSRDNCNALIETASNTLLYGCRNSTIPNSVDTIGEKAFAYCPITSVVIPESVVSIKTSAFEQCLDLTSLTLSEGLKSIGNKAFFGCLNLTSLTIPNSVTDIENGAFSSCQNLASLTLPKKMTSLGASTFSNCYALESVVIPDGIVMIGDNCFSDCNNLTSVNLPQSLTSIGTSAFRYCHLESIVLPKGLKKIMQNAFEFCSPLTDITCLAAIPPDCSYFTTDYFTYGPFSSYGTLHVPSGCKDAYASDDCWKQFEIVEDAGESDAGESGEMIVNGEIYTDEVVEGYTNCFIFSIQDSILSIGGYYAGNPNYTTKIAYTIIGHDMFLNLDTKERNVVETQPLKLDVAIKGCTEDYYFIYLSGYYGKTAIVDDYTLHETSYKGYGLRGFVREKPPKTDISTGQKDPKEQDDVDVVCRVRGIVGGHYQQRVRSREGNVINLDGTYNSQTEGDENVEATTSLGRLEAGEYKVVLNVTDADDVMPPFSATLTFRVGGTGVEVISCDGDSDVIFDLQGNPASRATEGLYIVNGKKVIFR